MTRWLAQDGPHETLAAQLDAAFAELASAGA